MASYLLTICDLCASLLRDECRANVYHDVHGEEYVDDYTDYRVARGLSELHILKRDFKWYRDAVP